MQFATGRDRERIEKLFEFSVNRIENIIEPIKGNGAGFKTPMPPPRDR
jgi:hypothetical protein